MTQDDLFRLERELSVRLPGDYRRVVADYPFAAEAGTSNGCLYDDAEALIEQNRAYRGGFAGLARWPDHFLFIGDDGAASCFLLDLRREPSPVYLADHGQVERLAEEAPSLAVWIERIEDEFRRDGMDPREGPPPAGRGGRLILILLATAAVASGIGYALSRWLWP